MIYADFNGSAPLCCEVKNYLLERLETGPFANPNAIHFLGTKTLMGMEKAREICAQILGAKKEHIIFNSGATEGIATLFHTFLQGAKTRGKNKIILSGIEHSAIFNTAESYQRQEGFDIDILKSNNRGLVDLQQLEEKLQSEGDRVAMVAVMAANNETGIVQPFEQVSDICKKYSVKYFADTTQYFGKIDFNFSQSSLEYGVLSGHKIGALPGTGILLAKDPTSLVPLIIGGGQERGYRGGTQNYIGNETLAVALTAFSEKKDYLDDLYCKRMAFEKKMKDKFPEIIIIGEDSPRLAGTTYLSYPGIHGQAVQIELEAQNIFVTTSSACSDNSPVTSKVLQSMGVSDDIGRGVVRISFSCCSSLEDYDTIFEALSIAYAKLIKIKSY